MKQIDIKIQQNKAHYDLDRQSANHQEMFVSMNFFTGTYVLPEKIY